MSWFEHATSRIYYEAYGEGDPVLLLPGLTGSIAELSELKEALSPHYKVIMADLPGSGRSEPQPRTYTASYYMEDAHAFIVLLQHLTRSPAHLVGFSDGGEVSLLISILEPGMSRSVVTWGAAGSISDPDMHSRNALYNVIDNPIPPLQHFSDYLKATYGENNARAMTQSVVSAFNDIIEGGGDISLSRAGDITCPVLLIVGEYDALATPALVSQLAARIPVVEMVEVEGVGHPVHQERPEWLAQTLLEWVKRH